MTPTRPLALAITALTTMALLTGCTNPTAKTPTTAPSATPNTTKTTTAPTPRGLISLSYTNHGQPLPGGTFKIPATGYTYTATCTGPAGASMTLDLNNLVDGSSSGGTITCDSTQTTITITPDQLGQTIGNEISVDVTPTKTLKTFDIDITAR